MQEIYLGVSEVNKIGKGKKSNDGAIKENDTTEMQWQKERYFGEMTIAPIFCVGIKRQK